MTQSREPMSFPPGYPGGSAGPSSPQGVSSSDPDQQGLPPDVVLPDAARYRRDQWFARFIVCLAGLLILLVITWGMEDHRRVLAGCIAAVGLAAIYSFIHYVLARRKVADASSGQK